MIISYNLHCPPIIRFSPTTACISLVAAFRVCITNILWFPCYDINLASPSSFSTFVLQVLSELRRKFLETFKWVVTNIKYTDSLKYESINVHVSVHDLRLYPIFYIPGYYDFLIDHRQICILGFKINLPRNSFHYLIVDFIENIATFVGRLKPYLFPSF